MTWSEKDFAIVREASKRIAQGGVGMARGLGTAKASGLGSGNGLRFGANIQQYQRDTSQTDAWNANAAGITVSASWRWNGSCWCGKCIAFRLRFGIANSEGGYVPEYGTRDHS